MGTSKSGPRPCPTCSGAEKEEEKEEKEEKEEEEEEAKQQQLQVEEGHFPSETYFCMRDTGCNSVCQTHFRVLAYLVRDALV